MAGCKHVPLHGGSSIADTNAGRTPCVTNKAIQLLESHCPQSTFKCPQMLNACSLPVLSPCDKSPPHLRTAQVLQEASCFTYFLLLLTSSFDNDWLPICTYPTNQVLPELAWIRMPPSRFKLHFLSSCAKVIEQYSLVCMGQSKWPFSCAYAS